MLKPFVKAPDLHKAVLPSTSDYSLIDESTNGEVSMQTVPAWMPLRSPQVWVRSRAEPMTQHPKESRDVCPHAQLVVTTIAAIGQRAEAIEPVCGAVATHSRPSTASRFANASPFSVSGEPVAGLSITLPSSPERSNRFASFWVDNNPPAIRQMVAGPRWAPPIPTEHRPRLQTMLGGPSFDVHKGTNAPGDSPEFRC